MSGGRTLTGVHLTPAAADCFDAARTATGQQGVDVVNAALMLYAMVLGSQPGDLLRPLPGSPLPPLKVLAR